MKKINLLLVMLLSMATSLMGKCDWSKVNLGKSNKCNVDTFEVSDSTSLPVKKLPKLPTVSIKIQPNPAADKVIFTVASTDKVASNTYEIYDSKGKLVMTGTMGGSICVGVVNLPNGVYTVKIGKLVQKFVVQH